MELGERLSGEEHRRIAARYRALAVDTTTARARGYLLRMANQCDGLAEGRIDDAPPLTLNAAANKPAFRSPFR